MGTYAVFVVMKHFVIASKVVLGDRWRPGLPPSVESQGGVLNVGKVPPHSRLIKGSRVELWIL